MPRVGCPGLCTGLRAWPALSHSVSPCNARQLPPCLLSPGDMVPPPQCGRSFQPDGRRTRAGLVSCPTPCKPCLRQEHAAHATAGSRPCLRKWGPGPAGRGPQLGCHSRFVWAASWPPRLERQDDWTRQRGAANGSAFWAAMRLLHAQASSQRRCPGYPAPAAQYYPPACLPACPPACRLLGAPTSCLCG